MADRPLFGLQVECIVGKPGAATALRIADLRITLDIKKDFKTFTNQAHVSIYNLAEATRGHIKELNQGLTIRAGYAEAGTLDEIFNGQIVTVSHQRDGADFVTKLEAGDGIQFLRQAKFNGSYVDGASLKRVMLDVLDKLGVPQKFVTEFTDQKFLQGFAFNGPAKRALDQVTQRAGLVWSIQGGQMKVQLRGKPDNSQPVLISPESGMIGSPERLQRLKDDADVASKPPGWKVTCLLQPKIEPGGSITFRSREVPKESKFLVSTVAHTADTFSGSTPAQSVVECIEPGFLL